MKRRYMSFVVAILGSTSCRTPVKADQHQEASSIQSQSQSSARETRISKTADGTEIIWTRATNEELLRAGVTNVQLFGEAWIDPTGVIWGDTALQSNGRPEYMTIAEATDYCRSLGARLPSAYFEKYNGSDGNPNRDSDFVRLRKYLGYIEEGDPKPPGYDEESGGYRPAILPHLNAYRHFWSSTHYGEHFFEFEAGAGGIASTAVHPYDAIPGLVSLVLCVVNRR